jgi:hypothetical protein
VDVEGTGEKETEEKGGGEGMRVDAAGVCVVELSVCVLVESKRSLTPDVVDPDAGIKGVIEGPGVDGGVDAGTRPDHVLVVPVSIEVEGKRGAAESGAGAGIIFPERGCGATYTMISSSSSSWRLPMGRFG